MNVLVHPTVYFINAGSQWGCSVQVE